jgi:hypothetical protein
MPRRSPLLLLVILATVFFGAAALGAGLAALFAPDSQAAAFVSFLLLPMALITGFQAWLGLAIIILVPSFLLRLLTGNRPASVRDGEFVPPGSVVFLPIASGLGFAGGAFVGLVSDAHAAWLVILVYWLAGTGYGLALWILARTGYLPFPDSG